MPNPIPPQAEKSTYVNKMFARIAPTYDRMNRLMTWGQDTRWREDLLSYCELPPNGRLLDVGTGTGDIAYAAQGQSPGVQAIGSDFTYEMMAFGQSKGNASVASIPFVQADALALPYADNSFDAVTSGFLIRNVTDIVQAFREKARVTRPGGKVVCLEITPPDTTVLGPFFQFYFFNLVPLLGAIVSGDGEAYRYLPHSTVHFPSPGELAHKMELAGLAHVFHVTRMLGTVAIHVGTKRP